MKKQIDWITRSIMIFSASVLAVPVAPGVYGLAGLLRLTGFGTRWPHYLPVRVKTNGFC